MMRDRLITSASFQHGLTTLGFKISTEASIMQNVYGACWGRRIHTAFSSSPVDWFVNHHQSHAPRPTSTNWDRFNALQCRKT